MAKNISNLVREHDPETKKIISDLRAELEMARSEANTAEVLRDFIGTARLKTTELDIPKWVIAPKKSKMPGVPKIMLSDLHWGERVSRSQTNGVNEYSIVIARRRLATVFESTIALCRIIRPEMDYPGIVVPLGGDMISGNIHDELVATNELNTMPALLDIFKHLTSGIRLMADTFGNVLLPCVSGNHDRDTKKTWGKDRNHTSFGWLLYQFLAVYFAEDPRITFYIPDAADANYRIYNTRYNLVHGDEFKGGDGIIGPLGPITRGEQKKNATAAQVQLDYDVMEFGHFHTRLLSARLRGNGSPKGYDEFAKRNNFKFERPSQNWTITHPDHGITFDAPVYCDTMRRPAAPWASVPRQIK